jgi:hypothetical protein
MADTTVIITNWKRPANTRRLLESLNNQTVESASAEVCRTMFAPDAKVLSVKPVSVLSAPSRREIIDERI